MHACSCIFGFIIRAMIPLTHEMRRLLFLCLFVALSAHAQGPSSKTEKKLPPDCVYCQEKYGTLEELRKHLPKSWRLQREQEPVFDSNILVVEAGPRQAQTLLLVHGLGQNGFTDWMNVLPQLAQHYHVLALDLPGFGYSDAPNGKYSPRNYARILSWLLKTHSEDKAIVVGHSMGGAVSLRFASEYPEQLQKLILVDAAGILHRSAYVKHPASLPLAVETAPAFLKGAYAHINDWEGQVMEKLTGLPDVTRPLDADERLWGKTMGDHANVNAGMSMSEEDFSTAIYTTTTPTQIIWGEKDPIAPLRTGQMLARRLPQAELHILPGMGHTPMEDPGDAQTFLSLLNEVLEAPPKPAAHQQSAGTADLDCKDKTDKTYSGAYREVRLNHCTAVKLHDLSAERIVLVDSIVEMSNVHIHSEGTALEIRDSALTATAGEIEGETAIRADDSRIDMAGFRIQVSGQAVVVRHSSRLIGSANHITSPDYTGYWQGNTKLQKAVLRP